MLKEIYFAGGCFWGTQRFLQQINGVVETQTGYANGLYDNVSYEEVCTDTTEFAECVKVVYNDEVINLSLLTQLFFETINPTSYNQQGFDVGSQYRTGVYYTNKDDLFVLEKEFKALQLQYSDYIETELLPLKNFVKAEDYHQDYLIKNPNGYCHLTSSLFEKAKKANR